MKNIRFHPLAVSHRADTDEQSIKHTIMRFINLHVKETLRSSYGFSSWLSPRWLIVNKTII